MVNSPNRQRFSAQPSGIARSRQPSKRFWARHGGGVAGAVIGGLLRGLVAKLFLALILTLGAYLGIAKAASLGPFAGSDTFMRPATTITATAVLTKLTGKDELHVATGTYKVNVQLTQSVWGIPCGLVCNQMTLTGTGTDDEILDPSSLSSSDIEVNKRTSAVTLFLPPPTTGPAILNPANCNITSSHGVLSSLAQGLHNNPNGFRPLYAQAESQIHDQALQDPRLLTEGENSARADLIRLLDSIGAKHVTVNFV
jgi:Protein of unknown function (DUF4230)